MPVTKPEPMPSLRRQAYQDGTSLLGPEADREGWLVLPTYTYAGSVFGNRKAEVGCTVSLQLTIYFIN